MTHLLFALALAVLLLVGVLTDAGHMPWANDGLAVLVFAALAFGIVASWLRVRGVFR